MGWSTYIVNDNKKLVVECGKIAEDQLRSEIEEWRKLREETCEWEGPALDKPVARLSLEDYAKLHAGVRFAETLAGFRARVLALDYAHMEEDIKVIGDDLVDSYVDKGYTVI